MRKLILAGVLLTNLSGCTDATVSQFTALGKNFKVNLYSGGKVVRSWESSGKVLTETQSDGWYFRDKTSGKLIRVSGIVTVEEL